MDKDVNDFLRVVPQEDGQTFFVEYLQPFGARGILKFSLETDAEVYAICFFDCSKKITGIAGFASHLKNSQHLSYSTRDYNFYLANSGGFSSSGYLLIPQSSPNKYILDLSKYKTQTIDKDLVLPNGFDFLSSFTPTYVCSPYTVDDNFVAGKLADGGCRGRGCQSIIDLAEEIGIHGVTIKNVEEVVKYGSYDAIPVGLKSLETYYDWGNSSAIEFVNKIANERPDITSLTSVTIVLPFTGTYSSSVFELDLKLNIQSYYIPGESITLDETSHIF